MELAIDHPYYASDSNYYSNTAGQDWDTMTEFLDEFEDADVDMNQVFRWDINPQLDDNGKPVNPKKYSAQVIIIGQRKGIYAPHRIELMTEDEEERFQKYLEKHWLNIQELWKPISK